MSLRKSIAWLGQECWPSHSQTSSKGVPCDLQWKSGCTSHTKGFVESLTTGKSKGYEDDFTSLVWPSRECFSAKVFSSIGFASLLLKFNITALHNNFTVQSLYFLSTCTMILKTKKAGLRELLPVGVSVIGGERHSMWNPLSHASQNKRLSCNQPCKSLSDIHNTSQFQNFYVQQAV